MTLAWVASTMVVVDPESATNGTSDGIQIRNAVTLAVEIQVRSIVAVFVDVTKDLIWAGFPRIEPSSGMR